MRTKHFAYFQAGCAGGDCGALFNGERKSWKTQTKRIRRVVLQNDEDCREATNWKC